MIKDKNFVNVKLKALTGEADDEKIIVEGFANYNSKDRDNDVVIPYGIDLTNFNKNPIILWQHRRDEPAGKVIKAEIRNDGLYVQAEVYKSVNPQAYAAVKAGVVSMFSIGFRGIEGEYNEETDTFYFLKVELLEISLVSIPANQDSKFNLVENPCEDGFCLLGKKGYKPESNKIKSSKVDNKEKEMTEEIVKLLQELVATTKELAKKTEVEEAEEASEEPAEVVEDEPKEKGLTDLIAELEVTEKEFDELMKAHEELSSKLNKFALENI